MGQLEEFAKSEFEALFERLRSYCGRTPSAEKILTFSEFLQGWQMQPEKERETYLQYLDFLIERCGLMDAYREAFLSKTSYAAPCEIQHLGDLGKSPHDHISAAHNALSGSMVR